MSDEAKFFLRATIAVLIPVLSACSHAKANRSFTLEAVRQTVVKNYPHVRQLSTAELASILPNPKDLLLLDVREPREFEISHLAGAIRIQPLDVFGQTNFRPTAANVRNKAVVFYCSVGVRSSCMAQKLDDTLKQLGADAVYNLDGGIFAWHNEKRALVNDNGPTDFVHPYDTKYSQLLKRQQSVRFAPLRLTRAK